MKRILFYILLFVCTIVSAQTPIYDDVDVWGELIGKKSITADDSLVTPLLNVDLIRFSDGSVQVTAGGFEDTLNVDIIGSKDSTEVLFISPVAMNNDLVIGEDKEFIITDYGDFFFAGNIDADHGLAVEYDGSFGSSYLWGSEFASSAYIGLYIDATEDYIFFQESLNDWKLDNNEWFNVNSPDSLLKSEGDSIFEEDKTAKFKTLIANDSVVAEKAIFDNVTSNSQTMGEVTVTGFGTSKDIMEGTVVDKFQFNPTTQSHSEGTLFYDSTERALAFYNEFPNFKEELNRGVNVPFYNNTGSTIPNGKIVRSIGAKVNGSIMFLADLAGNGSLDSLQGIALTTIETLDGDYGIASLVGPVSMNTSMWSDNDLLFVGHAGDLTNVNPTAPSYSDIVGRVQYADADSGVVYFFPVGEAKFRPAPVLSANFSRESEGIANGGIDVFSVITNATNDLFTETINTGFAFQGDSLSPLQDGVYTLSFSYSFQGDAIQNDDWRIGVFKNGVELYSTIRTSSTTNKGGVPFEATNSAAAGDWYSFRITNTTSATRTSTFTDGVISVTFND